MSMLVVDILIEVSYALFEDTILDSAAGVLPAGSTTISLRGSGTGFAAGQSIVIRDGANAETAAIASFSPAVGGGGAGGGGGNEQQQGGGSPAMITLVGPTVNSYNGPSLLCVPFSTPETPTKTLFTLPEMLDYVAEVQNDFLLKTRPIFNTQAVAIPGNAKSVAQPADAIRVERVVLQNNALIEVSQRDLDLENPGWMSDRGIPRRFYQDELGDQQIGIARIPGVAYNSTMWYSQRGPASVALSDALMVPRIFSMYIKYGVLAKVWSKDGEQRDKARGDYAQKRYELGIKLAQRFMDGSEIPVAKGRGNAGFNPLVVGG